MELLLVIALVSMTIGLADSYSVAIRANLQQDNSIDQEFLDAHNAARAAVDVPPLSWDASLAEFARGWASRLRDNGCTNLVHSGGMYGENLWYGPGSPSDAVGLWVAEQRFYDPESNQCKSGEVCGHYTQVVWSRSQKLGCAYLSCGNGLFVASCNYYPRGNIVGETPF